MRKLLKKQGLVPAVVVADKLGSYNAARRELNLSVHHEQGLRFLSIHLTVYNAFSLKRYLISRRILRLLRTEAA